MKKWLGKIPSSEITDETLFQNRRKFIQMLAGTSLFLSAGMLTARGAYAKKVLKKKLQNKIPPKSKFSTDEKWTPKEKITSYNNFYEFGTDKGDPARYAKSLKTRPWNVSVEGAVKKFKVYDVDELIRAFPIEERVYRLRCVEAWSMVVPWQGFQLSDLIKKVEPTSKAKYVEFTTLYDPKQMPGQRRKILDWPYVEGLRMDEAMNPLTIIATGLYGKNLPNQNGAPLRLVVPWKYGFKSIKSIVKIRFMENRPKTSWSMASPNEYGFYSNVNPNVSHPRWSQRKERRIGEFLKRETLIFNGYGKYVAHLYKGMDLRKFF